jgi:hypothetical protein
MHFMTCSVLERLVFHAGEPIFCHLDKPAVLGFNQGLYMAATVH